MTNRERMPSVALPTATLSESSVAAPGTSREVAAGNLTFGGAGGEAIRTLIKIALKRKFLIGSIFLLVILGGALVYLTSPSVYQANATLQIAREVIPVVESSDGTQQLRTTVDQEFYETQYGLLRSRALAIDVVRNLRLANNPGFVPAAMLTTNDPITAVNRERYAVDKLLRITSIVPARQSRLVDIRVNERNPVLAAQIANKLCELYIGQNLQRRVSRGNYAREFLDRRIREVRTAIENTERRLVAYASAQRIINLPSTGQQQRAEGTASNSLVGNQLAETSQQLVAARGSRAEAESRWRAAQANGANRLEMENPALTTVLAQRALLSGEIAQMGSSYDSNYPPLAAKRAQIVELDNQINNLRRRMSNAIRSDYEAARRLETTLENQVNSLTADIVDLSNRSIEYTILQREVDTNRQIYDGLLQQYKQSTVAADLGSNNVDFVLRAGVPVTPAAPSLWRTLLISISLGLLIGVGAALLLEILDARITTPEDFRERIEQPLIGVVPKVASGDPIAELDDPRSTIYEAYSTIAANLRFSTPEGLPHVMAVTSTRPSEGKSTTSLAVAAILARRGQSVVVIDGDMRRPTLHKRVGLKNGSGFANLLAGDSLESVDIHQLDGKTVHIITAGPLPPAPTDLLANPRLLAVVGMLRERFDRVIIDTPPVLGLADAPYIANVADGVLFVLEASGPRVGPVRRAIERIQEGRGKILGFVFTKYNPRNSIFDSYASYGYYSYDYKSKE